MRRLFVLITAISMALSTTPANAADWVKPIPSVTPGWTNPAVTQANIASTICKSGWTDTIRPPVSYTNKLKTQQLTGTYKGFVSLYGSNLSGYEEDHLISLQLGGNPTDARNLWPEPYIGLNARKKDVIETALKRLICSGKMTLVNAQTAIATDWVKAYNLYTTPADAKTANGND